MLNRNMEWEFKENILLSDRLAAALDAGQIRYCHWKSNEHLKAGLEGKTDLDLLVDRKDNIPFIKVLTDLGFRKVISSPETTYIAVENWIGFCDRTGILLHLHVHYELVTGMEYVKEYAFPWSAYVLDTAVRESESGILVTNPNVEIILLLLRLGVKAKHRTLLVSQLMKRTPYGEPMQKELDYLHERITCDGLEDALEKMFSRESPLKEILRRLVFKKQPDAAALTKVKREVDREFGRYRRYGRLETGLKSAMGEMKLKKDLIWEHLGRDVLRRKRFETGGIVIAIIGNDGKARGELVRNVEKWLRWKMDIHRCAITGRDSERNIERTRKLRLKGSIVLLEGGLPSPETTPKAVSSTKKSRYGLHVVPDTRAMEDALQKRLSAFSPDLVIRLSYAGDQLEPVRRIKPFQGKGSYEGKRPDDSKTSRQEPGEYEVDGNRPLEEIILDTRRIIWNNV